MPYVSVEYMIYLSGGHHFWSVRDGSYGKIERDLNLRQFVSSPLVITAWYWPVSGPYAPPTPGLVLYAFSAALGRFVGDTFATVTSDPSLTNGANVVGYVPTQASVTLQAASGIQSSTEPFFEWLCSGACVAAGAQLSAPAQ